MKKKINIIIIFLFSLSFQAQVCSDFPEITATSTTICSGLTTTLSINYTPPIICNMNITPATIPLGNPIPGFTYGGMYNGHYYYVYNTPTSWTQGELICRQNGGYLVCINDINENAFVSNLTNNNIWIGLFRDPTTCQFRWLDCMNINFTNWRTSEPNGDPCGEPYTQIIRGCSFGLNTWNNLNDNSANGSCYSNMVPILEIDPIIYNNPINTTTTYLWSTGETTASISPTPLVTTTYWVDVTINGATCRKNITINVTPTTTPAFNQIEPICSGAALNPLPTTSNNGITGTWSPALNNTTTTTYTFSPDSGQCANATTTRLEVLNCNTNCCINLSTLSTNQTLLNTYYPAQNSQTITPSSSFINLDAVPSIDIYGNSFGDTPIKAGDLLLIIQMQGANFNSSNSTLYGSGIANFGLDNLGATGFTDIENTGIYEYVIALNDVPLSGGRLEINGSCNGGLKNTYQNIPATANSVIKRFQVIRVPKFQNLKLSNNIETTAWNGTVGGVIAFIVTDELDLNGFTINASGRGFRGGFQNVRTSGNNNNTVRTNSNLISSGKGEGISGTPRFMWNGVNAIDYGISWIGYKDGDYGRGAPGNAGGGGNTHNAGGGGGGNGGFGGVGANGVVGFGGSSSFPIGGRMGSFIPFQSNRIFLGGGGGGGDANNATTGVKGGPGGGVIILQSKTIKGNGQIIANGLAGEPGVFFGAPDGAGGGGAGGSILILTREPSPTASISIEIKGGKGGNTLNDLNDSHGPGGGGGGGIIMHNIQGANLNIITSGGNNGLTGNGTGVSHGASSGQNGTIFQLNQNNIPDQVNDLFPSPKSYFIAANTCQGEIFKPINQSNVSNLRSSLLVSYIWNFGDGSTSSTINPTHVYSKPGNYEVSLEVRTNWGCIDKFSQIISVAPSILPIFSQINAICSGESLTPLPTTSTNGIIGSWSPSLNNEATTTYTFTPDAGQCALNTTMTINVNPKTIPSLFTPIAAICSGATLTPIPTTSTNGIIGSWSPSLNNEATTTYTFTPDTGQCALNTSLTVEVKVIPIPTLGLQQIFCTKPVPTIAQLNAIGSAIKWYNSAIATTNLSASTPLAQNQTYFASQTIDGCESVQRLEKKVDIINCDVVIFNSIKVDAEPMSDRLYIDDISYFPNNSIQIFNRYGRLVWETKGYNNDTNAFKGKANVPDLFQKDEQLPAGTYFYILNYFNFIDRTQKEKNGYLQLFNSN